jgi:hypothetical protein
VFHGVGRHRREREGKREGPETLIRTEFSEIQKVNLR